MSIILRAVLGAGVTLTIGACSSSGGGGTSPATSGASTTPSAPSGAAIAYFEGAVDVAARTMSVVVRSPDGRVQSAESLPYGTGSGDVYFHTCSSPAISYTTSGAGGTLTATVEAVNNMSAAVSGMTVKMDAISDTGTTFVSSPSTYGTVPNTGDKTCAANTATWTFTQTTTTNFTFTGEADGTPVVGSTTLVLSQGYTQPDDCLVTTGGTTECWGGGNLGNGSTLSSYVPVVADLPSGTLAVATGTEACAVTSAGGVDCWSSSAPTPSPMAGLSSGVTAIGAGSQYNCALMSGAVYCWGYDSTGQLGSGGNLNTTSTTPILIAGLPSGITSIAAGGEHVCALTSGGAVYCWGSDSNGQIGNGVETGTSETYVLTPVEVTGLSSGVTAITAGATHTCALTSGGAMLCWGYGYFGQLGQGNGLAVDSSTPVSVENMSSGVIAISAGQDATCAVKTGGSVYCWGTDNNGELGQGGDQFIGCGPGQRCAYSSDPLQLKTLSGVTSVSEGYAGGCAATSAGKVYCWGYNVLGGGNTNMSPTELSGF